jgi:hypothetical protein
MISSAATAANPNVSTLDLLFPVAPINCVASFSVSSGESALDQTKRANLLDPRCVYDQANKLQQQITAFGSSKELFRYDVTRDLASKDTPMTTKQYWEFMGEAGKIPAVSNFWRSIDDFSQLWMSRGVVPKMRGMPRIRGMTE